MDHLSVVKAFEAHDALDEILPDRVFGYSFACFLRGLDFLVEVSAIAEFHNKAKTLRSIIKKGFFKRYYIWVSKMNTNDKKTNIYIYIYLIDCLKIGWKLNLIRILPDFATFHVNSKLDLLYGS